MDVGAWLRGLGLGRYERAFSDNDVDADLLARLTAEDLREIGVASVGHRRRLLDAIAALRRADAPLLTSIAEAAAHPRGAEPSRAERRQLTVLFADLVGSTALAARLDPEDLRELIGAYHARVAAVVEREGGFVAKYMGDGVLAYFGWPQAHEDDAERAIRSGLGLVTAVRGLATPETAGLRVRVGIATGLAVVGDLLGSGAAREEAVVGETPNLAARLQGLAEPDSVVIAESTRRLVGDLFECADLGAVEPKGFAGPVRAYRVTGAGAVASRSEALHAAPALTPLVGREEELDLLLRRWRQAKGGEGRVVLLSGEPGVGKSRLLAALQEHLAGEPHLVLRYFCSPHHRASALYPVTAQLERAAGFGRDDATEARLAKLEALLAPTAPPAEDVALLAELLSLPTGDRCAAPPLAPERKRERTFAALLRRLVALAAGGPALVVFEDVHWVDPSTRELLDLAVARAADLPVLLLATFRPEFAPPWTGQPHVTALALSRLGPREGAALVRRVAGSAALPEAVVAEIVERTDGVPLFAEELTKAVLEAGAGNAASAPATLAIPATLHASLMARLDRLGPAAREAAQVGAAVGREFSHELLAAVADLDEEALAAALGQLLGAGLLFRRGEGPEAGYLFKHALVRDAAYGSLLRSKRRQLHARIAAVLEERFAAVAEAQPELLARHCAEAGLAEKAVGYRYEAGRRAMARSAMAEAVAQLTQALELLAGLPAGRDRDRTELDLRIALGRALYSTRSWAGPEVGEAYGRARELCTEEAQRPQLLAVLSGLFMHHLQRSGVGVAERIAGELLGLAERERDVAARAAGHRLLGVSSMFAGRFRPALAHLEQALALHETADRASPVLLWAPDGRVTCLDLTALILLWQGYPERALARSRDGLAAAHELDDPHTTSMALDHRCWLHHDRDEPRLVLEQAATLMTVAADQEYPAWLAEGTGVHGWALAATGEVAAGVAGMRRTLAAKRASGVLLSRPPFLGMLAEACIRAGDPSEALILLAEALAIVEGADGRCFEAELHRLRGEALLRGPVADRAGAEACLHKAIEVAREQGARWWELRATASLARLWADGGERRKAHDLLAPVYGWFTEGFDTPDLRNAKRLLDELR